MTDTHPVHELTTVQLETDHGLLSALARPGHGSPIVLVHGAMADAEAWRSVVESVAPDRPALVVNRRGRRPSGPIPVGYGVESEVEDLLRWLETQGAPVDLVGHSYGGLIAVEAVRRGAAVRSLVLYEPVTRPFGVEALPLVATAVDHGDLDSAAEIINVDLSGYGREYVDTLRSGSAWPKLMELAAPAGAELAAIDRFDLSIPGSWSVPTTLIAGELSRHRAPYGPSVDVFREALGVGQVVILDGQDHLAHVTAPLDLARAIEGGLGDPGALTASTGC